VASPRYPLDDPMRVAKPERLRVIARRPLRTTCMKRDSETAPDVRYVEIIGPAGSGKTTLARRLVERNPTWRLGRFPVSRHQYPWRYVRRALFGFPAHLVRGCFDWSDVCLRIQLEVLHDVSRLYPPAHAELVLFDQGPLFQLWRLMASRYAGPCRRTGESWWNVTLRRWAAKLDKVIWLDAPNAVLLQRILARQKRHRLQNKPESEAVRVLRAHRQRYRQLISSWIECGGSRPLPFDTSERLAGELLADVTAACRPPIANLIAPHTCRYPCPIPAAAERSQPQQPASGTNP